MKLLLITNNFPSKYHAGGLRILDLYEILRKLKKHNFHIELITSADYAPAKSEHIQIRKLFDHIHYFKLANFEKEAKNFLSLSKSKFDFIDIQYHQSASLINYIKKKWPTTTISFTPMESQVRSFFILLMTFQLFKVKRLFSTFILACQEIYYINLVDQIVYVNKSDMKTSGFFCFNQATKYYLDTWVSEKFFSARKYKKSKLISRNIIFLAYFKSFTNIESLLWFCKEVHPVLTRKFSDYKLNIVGEGLDKKTIEELKSPEINFYGRVDDLTPILLNASVGIVPALSGAGVRGKIHQYAAFGIPSVTTSIASKALEYKSNKSIFIANSSQEYADQCNKLLSDRTLRLAVGDSALKVCMKNYTSSSAEKKIKYIYQI